MSVKTRLDRIPPPLGRRNDELQFAKLAVIDNALAFYTIGCANVVYRRLEQVRHKMRGNGFCTHRTEMRRNPFWVRPEKFLHQLFAKAFVLVLPEEKRRSHERKRFKTHHREAFFELSLQAVIEERRMRICPHRANTQKMFDALTLCKCRKRERQTQINFFLGGLTPRLLERRPQAANHGIAAGKVLANAGCPLLFGPCTQKSIKIHCLKIELRYAIKNAQRIQVWNRTHRAISRFYVI